jgi:polyhydroxybutyrate depolymerase
MTARSRPAARRRAADSVAPSLAVLAVLVVALLGTACSDDGDAAPSPSGAATTSRAGRSATTPTSTTEPPRRASAGCGTEPPIGPTDDPAAEAVATIRSDDRDRLYRIALPHDYDPERPVPVVFNLHGSGSNAAEQSVYTQVPTRGAARGYLVVTPDAGDGDWELGPDGEDDRFLVALLDHVAASWCVDLDRVHATGISLGSWKATITACTHPDRFASLALVAEEVAPPDCAKPVVAFHGTADFVVPFGAGADPGIEVIGPNAGLPGVEVNMPRWAANGGCSTEHDVERIGSDVERWTYRDCPEGMDVVLYVVRGGGHTWPGSPIDRPGTTRTIDATEIALDWFDAHPLRR